MKKLLSLLMVFFAIAGFSQEKRIALVIGNSAYKHGGVLRNPVNDAMSMKKTLTRAGFEVMDYYNLSQGEMKAAIDEFGMKLRGYQVGLFFFAGHGIQTKGDNYLIPVDAMLQNEMQVEYDCVRADRVLAHMDASRADVNIVILDACRNNPFERSWNRSGAGKGLAFMNAPTGTLIAYATAPGSVASDGTGMNGLYTESILENLMIPDISILEMFQLVRKSVSQKSNYQQTPWESTSLVGNFYFHRSNMATATSGHTDQPIRQFDSNIQPEENFMNATSGKFIDIRDKEDYSWIRIGDQIWMAENLNHRTSEGSMVYGDQPPQFGRLYNWEAAKDACPDGWHLPTDQEWMELEMHLGMSKSEHAAEGYRGKNVGGQLKETGTSHWDRPNKGATNTTGFRALPGGYGSSNTISNVGSMGYFWTSTEKDLTAAWYRRLFDYSGEIERDYRKKTDMFSVRCVRVAE
ncbi:MAG TPA: hypothetical protein ENO20_10630 [Bacteroides sp.]|nr:hypothetical protein [Bacteroides sp.]